MAAQQQQQQHPPTEQQPQAETQGAAGVNIKKASAKENLAFLTSGAKEKLDTTLAGMKGAAHIITHPFNKGAKEEATAKTIEQKNEIADKQERIRATAHMQLLQEKATADGVDLGAVGSGRSAAQSPPTGAQQPEPGYDTERDISASGDKTSEESSDGSSRGRAQALNQIPPDSQDYQSG